jgi:hypothetical protein
VSKESILFFLKSFQRLSYYFYYDDMSTQQTFLFAKLSANPIFKYRLHSFLLSSGVGVGWWFEERKALKAFAYPHSAS